SDEAPSVERGETLRFGLGSSWQSSTNSIKVDLKQHAAAVAMQWIRVRPKVADEIRTTVHVAILQAHGMSLPGKRGDCIGSGRSRRGDNAVAEGLRTARIGGGASVPWRPGTHGTSW